MLWIWLIGSTVLIAVVFAGRAHSRYLDRVQARSQFLILPLAAGDSRIRESSTVADSVSNELPVAVFMGEQILVCSVPAGKTHEIFRVRNDVRRAPDATKEAGVSYPSMKPEVRDAFAFRTSQSAS